MLVKNRPKYLFAVPSSCQMYSGTGRAIFDFVDHTSADFEFTVVMDTDNSRNVGVMSKFCHSRSIPLIISEPSYLPGCCDPYISCLASHLHSTQYDVIECISFANAATNLAVLESRRKDARLVFTPHTQPSWTLGPEWYRYFMVPDVFQRMLKEVDAVFLDSEAERTMPDLAGCDDKKLHVVALGVNTNTYAPRASWTPGNILCVCDCREPRKRIDTLLSAFAVALSLNPDLHLTLAGMGSDLLQLPKELKHAVSLTGYVTEEKLVDMYQTTSLFALLSDFEAFGLPIAEALCCGTPVLLNRKGVPADLFTGMPGVHWADNTDSTSTGALLAELAVQSPDPEIAPAAVKRFSWEGTYGRKRDIALELASQ